MIKTWRKGVLIASMLGASSAVMADMNLMKVADPKVSGQYVRERFVSMQRKPFDVEDQRKKVLIIGDSQAQDFLNSAMENGFFKNFQVRTRHIPTQCQLHLGVRSGITGKDKAMCSKMDSLQAAKQQIANSDVLILAALWRDWAADQMPATIKNLKLKPTQQVVVIGRKSFGRISIRHYLRMGKAKRLALRNPVNPDFLDMNERMRSKLPEHSFVDQYAMICGKEKTDCPVFTPQGNLISFDGGHLTKAGAVHVGKLIFNTPALKRVRSGNNIKLTQSD